MVCGCSACARFMAPSTSRCFIFDSRGLNLFPGDRSLAPGVSPTEGKS